MLNKIKMTATRNRGASRGKAARENHIARGGPLQICAHCRQQLVDGDEDEVA